MRVCNRLTMRRRCSSESEGEWTTSNVSVTRLLTLLTFCPPGPPLRDAEKFSSASGMESSSLTTITMRPPAAAEIDRIRQLVFVGRGIVREMRRELFADRFDALH